MGKDEDSAEGSNFLKLSDVISLFSEEGGGYLAAEGSADVRALLYHNTKNVFGDNQKPWKFGDCLFRVLPQHTFTSAKGLRRFNKKLAAKKDQAASAPKSFKKRIGGPVEEVVVEEEEEEVDDSGLQLKRLTEQCKQEVEANEVMLEEEAGQPVCYGMIIQLQHVKTGMFVATQPKLVAEHERSCSAVLLQSRISSGCFFKVESRYKFREDGARVLKTDEIFLVNLKVEQYLHAAQSALPGQELLRECNASQALKTRWKVSMFSVFEPGEEEQRLMAGSVVRLYHPESDTAIVVGPVVKKTGRREVLMKGFDGESSLEKSSTNALWVVEKEEVTEGGVCTLVLAGMPCGYRFRHIATGRYLAGHLPDANFVIEEEEEEEDEIDELEAELEDEEEANNNTSKAEALGWQLSVEDITRESNSLFHLEAHAGSNLMDKNAAALLQHARSSRYIYAGEAKKDKTDSYEGAIASHPSLGPAPLDEHTLVIRHADVEEVNDLYFVLGCKPMLEAFVSRMTNVADKNYQDALPKEEEIENQIADPTKLAAAVQQDNKQEVKVKTNVMDEGDDPAADKSKAAVAAVKEQMANAKSSGSSKPTAFDVGASVKPLTTIEAQFIAKTLETLIFFLTATESTDPFTCEGLPNPARQKLMREQGMGELLVEVLQAPYQAERFAPYDLSELLQGHPIIDIGQLTYRLLHHMSMGYERNEFALAPYIDLFIDQSCNTNDDNDLFAEATLTGLVSNNVTLLNDQIEPPQLKLFVDLLLEQDKDARYVKLLAATCSCAGKPISSNQEALGELILDDPQTLKELCIRTSLKDGVPHIMFVDYKMGSPTALMQFLEDDDQEMIEYYISMLGLFSEICFDRNYKGIFSVESLYKYDTVLECMKMRTLPFTLRASFSKMLLTLHVDREPQTVVRVPNYTRTDCECTPAMGWVSGQAGRDFKDVKEFVLEYLEEMGGQAKAWETDKNQMTLYVLEMVRFLISAGFYSDTNDVRDLVNPLINNMDGTNDLTFEADDERVMADVGNTLRYDQREGTVPIMEAKLKMCEILLLLSDLRLDNRITELLKLYRSSGSEILLEDFDNLFQSSEVDIQELSDKNVVAILMDLNMYNHSGLVDGAFKNLVTHFTQRAELLNASERVQLLTDPTLISLHDQVKKDLKTLHALVETEELWLGEPGGEERAGEVMRILSTLLSYCEPPEAPAVEGKPGKKRRQSHTADLIDERGSVNRGSTEVQVKPLLDLDEARELLRNLGAHRGVVEVLEIERLLVVDIGLDLLCVCHRFLQAFADESPGNIAEITDFMPLFMEHMASPDSTVVTAAAETLTVIGASELTKETVEACFTGKGHVMTPVPVIDGRALAQCSINLACLELLKGVTHTDGKPNKKNQMLVMKVLMDPKRLNNGPMQHQWLTDKGSIKLFGQQSDASGGNSNFSPETLLLEPANVQLIHLLVECCRGKNGLVQAKCQGVFSLQDIAIHMENLKQHYQVKKPLLDFLYHAYLNAENSISEELAHSTLFKIFITDIEFVVADKTVDEEESDYIFGVLLPAIESYFRDFAAKAKGSDDQVEMARSILGHIVELFECCRKPWQKSKCSDLTRVMLRNEKLFKNVLSKGEWQPRTHKIQKVFQFSADETPEDEENPDEEDQEEAAPKKRKSEFVRMMDRARKDEAIQDLVEVEFEQMCTNFKEIESITEESFPNCLITFEGMVTSLIELADINDFNLSMDLSQAALKILRKMIEMENPETSKPASEWESEDWEEVQDQIIEWQAKMYDLGCVTLVMNLVGNSPDTPVIMDAIDLGVTMLLGGNVDVQDGFADASSSGQSTSFYRKLDDLLVQSYDEMKASGGVEKAAAPIAPTDTANVQDDDDEAPLLNKDEEGLEMNDMNDFIPTTEEEEEEEDEEEDDFDENKNATIVFRFMQLMCEGHNLQCQKLMQKQPANVTYDLIARTLSILRLLTCDMPADLDEDRMEAAVQALDTLAEVVQGPCPSAQSSLMDAKVLDVCTQIMADHFTDAFPDCDGISDEPHPLIMDAKEKSVVLLLSLLEGVSSRAVYRRFGEMLDFEVLKSRMAHVYRLCVDDPDSVADATEVPEDVYFGDLGEAFGIFMLISTVALHSEQGRQALQGSNYTKNDRYAVEFFQQNTGCIEINWSGKLERVYYPIPPICEYLTEATKEKVKWGVNRESPGEKLQSFFEYTTELHAEMLHLEVMSKSKALAFLSLYVDDLKSIQLLLALAVNALLVYSFKTTRATRATDLFEDLTTNIEFHDPMIKLAVTGLNGLVAFFALLIFISMCCTFGPLSIKNAWAERQLLLGKPTSDEELPEDGTVGQLLRLGPDASGIKEGTATTGAKSVYWLYSLMYFVSDTVVLLHGIYLLLAVCGCILSPFFLCFHLLDLVYRSETLKNVLRAVTFNGQQLLMTAMLCLIVIYIYSIIGFTMLRNNYFNDDLEDERMCDRLMDCFMVTVREGLINGGGMGDYLQARAVSDISTYLGRFFFDLSFFIIIIIILLNVIFGIIIDTFAAMREVTDSKASDMKTVCFICGNERPDLDRNGSGFDNHINKEHNMWKYCFYVVYLLQKDPTEYTGLETYVSNLIEEEDMNFYPMHRAMCLDNDEEEEDPFQTEVNERFVGLSNDMAMLKKTVVEIKSESIINQSNLVDLNKQTLRMLDNILEQQQSNGKLAQGLV